MESIGGLTHETALLGLAGCQMTTYVRPKRSSTRRSSAEVLERDSEGRKKCLRCANWKPEDAFYKGTHTSDGRQPDCIECYLWRNTLRMFGMSREQWESIFEAQGSVCAICGSPGKPGQRLSVDHDHVCCKGESAACGNCNRGLLCGNCNWALGMVEDSIDRLKSMITYLEEYA